MKKVLLFLFIFFFLPGIANAQRGCCSYHQGVNGCDSSVGRLVCNDGTYSPTCTCPVNPPATIYIPPATSTPTPIINSSKANVYYDYSALNNIYSIKFDWSDVPGSKGYSTSISKYPGSDPGSIIDTKKSIKRFNKLTYGSWYVNLKSFNGYSWSPIVYWKVTLPYNDPILDQINKNKGLKTCLDNAVPNDPLGILPSTSKSDKAKINACFNKYSGSCTKNCIPQI